MSTTLSTTVLAFQLAATAPACTVVVLSAAL
jgi:hypothetical protein